MNENMNYLDRWRFEAKAAESSMHAGARSHATRVISLIDALDAALARAEAAEAELRAIREEVRADPAAKTVDAVAALLASARCTVQDQTAQAENLRMMLDVTTDKLNEYIDKTVEAERRARDAEREAERLRHGVPIEGDFVCPNDLRATTAERERDAYRAGLIVAIEAMHRWGAEGDGVPEGGFIGEAFDRGRALVKLGPEVRHG